MADRNIIRIDVFTEYGSTEWSIEDFLADIADAVAEIPEQYRAEAKVELEGWYDETTKLVIWYRRPETDEEIAQREAIALRYRREAEQRERMMYEALKSKYGG